MRKIQILGTGCSRCTTLAANAERAIAESGVDFEVVKVRQIAEILAFEGVSALPAIAIDGVVKSCGRTLSPA
ncbi:thioredoxin family protein [Paludisphaera soli]|uniref:thioredoxin family protein n=1 Tax=Paludisphaera soli TaxID=2712865 RepID=UPI0013ED909D|nr:thioredoxin family protein [Paludisphaera soli]